MWETSLDPGTSASQRRPRQALPILCLSLAANDSSTSVPGRALLESPHLRAGGFTEVHVAALVAAGCLEQACVARVPGASNDSRQSRERANCRPGLLLTEFGQVVLPCYFDGSRESGCASLWISQIVVALRHMAERPIWNARLGELWWHASLIKRFREDAANQRCVLDGFQDGGWMRVNENPLPAHRGLNRKRQLKYTIRDLNRGQHPTQVRFHGNGRGDVQWDPVT